jgi:hypothetical protein
MLPGFLIKFRKATNRLGQEIGVMSIIIRRPYAHLEEEIRNTFKGQEGVRVLVDQRNGDRRKDTRPVKHERRKVDRRRAKYEVLEVVISV